jgi:hypothetical protein
VKTATEAVIDLEKAARTIWEAFRLEHGLTFEEGVSGAKDQYGTPYDRLVCRGVMPFAADWPIILVDYTPDNRMMFYCNSLQDYLAGRKHIVFRTWPNPVEWVDSQGRHCSQMVSWITAYDVKPLESSKAMPVESAPEYLTAES